MNLAELTLGALTNFAGEVRTWTNSGVLRSIEEHIAQIESAAATDLHAGENAAKAVWADLYGAFHGQEVTPASPTEPTPAPAPAPTVVESNTPAAPVPTPAAGGSALATPSTASESTEAASPAPVSAETPTVLGEPGPEVPAPAEPTA